MFGRDSTPGWLPWEFQEMAQTLSDLAFLKSKRYCWRFIFLKRDNCPFVIKFQWTTQSLCANSILFAYVIAVE
jgi:hypothetical protein